MHPHLQLHQSSGNVLTDPTPYRRLVGRLLYLTHPRPEISYVVSKLSQFLASPTYTHMLAALHVDYSKYEDLHDNLSNKLSG
jgi:hypothetical protein